MLPPSPLSCFSLTRLLVASAASRSTIRLAALGAPLPVFGDLPLRPPTATALATAGVVRPTAIQQAAMMRLYRGESAVIHSATGSGKTLAYLLPLLQRLHVSKPGQLLVVVPSRELALQTAAAVEWAWPHHGTQRAFLLTATSSAAVELAEAMHKAACPVVVATPRPLLSLVRHLAGTDRIYSRRAIRIDGEELINFASRLRAVVLDEADALVLSRQIAISGPPKMLRGGRAAWRDPVKVGRGGVRKADSNDPALFERPETFTLPVPRSVQALINARIIAAGRGSAGRSIKGRGRGGRGSRGREKGGGNLQLVACSATVSYRLTAEMTRLLALEEMADLPVITESNAPAPSKRKTGERGRGAVGVPRAIAHSWAPVPSHAAKPEGAAVVIRAIAPPAALYFVRDDESVSTALEVLRAAGLDARALHETLGLAGDGATPHSASGYFELQRTIQDVLHKRRAFVACSDDTGVASISTGDGADDDAPVAPRPTGGSQTEELNVPLVLVSSFGSARGLDLGGEVDCVVLSSLPELADTYLHLAGRTGRCGRQGRVVTLLAPEEQRQLGKITRQLGISVRGDADLALSIAEAVGTDGATAVAEAWAKEGPIKGSEQLFDDSEWTEISW